MDQISIVAIVGLVAIVAGILGYLADRVHSRRQIEALREKYVALNDKFANERTESHQQMSRAEQIRVDISKTLTDITTDAPEARLPGSSNDRFVEAILKPLQVSLHSADQQVKRINREKDKASQLIQQQLDIMKAPQKLGRGSSREIASALGDAEARHHWARNTLKHLLDLSYMTDHYRSCRDEEDDSKDQKTFPPCQVETPSGDIIAIDINAPLEPYVNVCQAPDASVRTWHMETHARKLRERLREMSGRVYKSQFTKEPELTLLLVLNDHYLSAALEVDASLANDSVEQGVVIATPSDLLSLLQAISFSWRQQTFANDAQEMRQTGLNLYRRFGTFSKLMGQLGSELTGVLDSYNAAVTYFENAEPNNGARAQGDDTPDATPTPQQNDKKRA